MKSGIGTHETMDSVKWIRKAVLLAYFTILYNLIEGIISIGFGISDESIALAGFGVDSLIEVASAFLVLWRFKGETGQSESLSLKREKRATLGIGILFLLLGTLTIVSAAFQLVQQSHPGTTVPGLIVSSLSLSFMFFLWISKRRVATALNSATVMKDADCSLACIKLSIILFLGSLIFLVAPQLWWADAFSAILLAILILREGWETVQATRKNEFSGGCGCSH